MSIVRQHKSARIVCHVVAMACVLGWCATSTRAQSWPFNPGATPWPIYSTYGQYYEAGGGLHLHEGLDIIIAPGTDVVARQAGTVLGVSPAAAPNGFMTMLTVPASGAGLNYIHMAPGARLAGNNGVGDPGGPWAAGDTVNVGDVLGTVQAFPAGSHPTHLHLDVGQGADPFFASSGAPANTLRRPTTDPLTTLAPQASPNNPTPVVSSGHRFRIASHDRDGTLTLNAFNLSIEAERTDNLYFDKTVGGRLVIGTLSTTQDSTGTSGGGSADVDIIAMAYDQATVGGTRNTPLSIDLQLFGHNMGGSSGGLNTIYNFAGQYLQGAGTNGYTQMRDPNAAWIRTIYSNDATTDSKDVIDADNANRGTYFFQMTNFDGDQLVEVGAGALNDRARYWNTDIESGRSFWQNPVQDAAAGVSDALANHAGAFLDDLYDVNVVARDHGGKFAASLRTIFLDNWLQTVTVDKAQYGHADDVLLTGGDQYAANDVISLYLLDAAPTEGQILNNSLDSSTTDLAGLLVPMNLGSQSVGDYTLVADYDGDARYYSPLDAITSFTVVPAPAAAVAGLTLLVGLGPCRRARRDRREVAE